MPRRNLIRWVRFVRFAGAGFGLVLDCGLAFFCLILFARPFSVGDVLYGNIISGEGDPFYFLLFCAIPIPFHVLAWTARRWKRFSLGALHVLLSAAGIFCLFYIGKLSIQVDSYYLFVAALTLLVCSAILRLPARLKFRFVPVVCALLIVAATWQVGSLTLRASSRDIDLQVPPGVRILYRLPEDVLQRTRWFEPQYAQERTIRNLELGAGRKALYFSDFSFEYTRIIRLNPDDPAEEPVVYTGPGMYRDLAYDAANHRLLAANFFGESVDVFDADSLERRASLPAFRKCQNIFVCRETADFYIVSEHGPIRRYGPDFTWKASGSLRGQPQEFFLDELRDEIFGCSFWADRIFVVDTETLSVKRGRRLGLLSWGCDVDILNGRVFVSRLFEGDLVILERETLEVLGKVRLQTGVRSVKYVPGWNVVLVLNFFNGKLCIVDPESASVMGCLHVGACGRDIEYSEPLDRVFLTTGLRVLELSLNDIIGQERP